MPIVEITVLSDRGWRFANLGGSGAELTIERACAYCGTELDSLEPRPLTRKRCRSCGAPTAYVEHAGQRMSVEEARARGIWPQARRRDLEDA